MPKKKLTPEQRQCRDTVARLCEQIQAIAAEIGVEVTTSSGNLYIGRRPVKSAPVVHVMAGSSIYDTIYIGPKGDWEKVTPEATGLEFFETYNPYKKENGGVWVELEELDLRELLEKIKEKIEIPA
ncbi:MAG: hypothetical protein AAGA35_04390 [Patescibacteria group bacterium]